MGGDRLSQEDEMEATTEASFPSFAFNHRTPALMGKLPNLPQALALFLARWRLFMTTALEVCQDIPIPREVEALGRPLRVHREEGCVSGALLVFLLGVFLLLAAGTCTFIYLKVPMKKD